MSLLVAVEIRAATPQRPRCLLCRRVRGRVRFRICAAHRCRGPASRLCDRFANGGRHRRSVALVRNARESLICSILSRHAPAVLPLLPYVRAPHVTDRSPWEHTMQRIEQWKRITAVVPVVVFGVASLVASGGGDVTNDPDCRYFALTEDSCFRAAPPGPSAPPVAQSKRLPVVAVSSAGARAAIMSTERENHDPQRPVQKFGSSFTFVPPTLGQPAGFGRPNRSDFRFFAKTCSGGSQHNARYGCFRYCHLPPGVASNAGTPELYA